MNEFKDYFADNGNSCVGETVSLNVQPDAKPTFARARTVPVRMREEVRSELQRLVNLGKISKVYSSEWASPTVNVMKSDGSVRICGDFSATVNKYLDPVHTPLPTIDEVIARVGTATVFSKIDLVNAFLQLPLNEESKVYTTINTLDGLYRYNYLPFGLTASPGIFQAFMNKLLNNIESVIVYQDDLLIMSPNREEHRNTLGKVLNILRKAGIKLNVSKSSFFTDEVQYLGHVFSSEGVHPNPEKVRAVHDAPSPENLKQLQAFLGLCNYYSRFIPGFSDVLSPLYYLLGKNVKFKWGPSQEESFQSVKKLLTSNKFLKMFNPKLETMLETDSSGYGIAAVLMQKHNNEWFPVQYSSRTLNVHEKGYSNIEREGLSVVFGVEKFKHFLLGGQFTIKNDQQPLRKLLGCHSEIPTNCSARIQRWALRMSLFDYVFEYSKGINNVHSDCFSRLPLPDIDHECEPYELIFAIDTLEELPLNCGDIKKHTTLDPALSQLMSCIKYGWPIGNNDVKLSQYKHAVRDMTLMKGCILYNNRVVVPEQLRNRVLLQFHEGHPGICAMKSLARSLIWYPGLDNDITNLVKACSSCQVNQARPPKSNLNWSLPSRVWGRVHIDHLFIENKTCLIAVDALSKYIECEVVSSTSVSDTIEALKQMFSRQGLCDLIVSDNASCFTAEKFREFLRLNDIDHITPPPYSPASNGQAERGVRVIKDLLKKCTDQDSFKSRLAKALLYYRSTPHSVTQIAPSVSLNNRKLITVKDRINPKFCTNQRDKIRTQMRQFEIGDTVQALNLRHGPKWLKATVVEKLGANIYNVHIHCYDIIWKRHLNQLLLLPDHGGGAENVPNSNSNIEKPLNVPITLPPNYEIPNADGVISQSGLSGTNDTIPTSSPPLRRSGRIKKPVNRFMFD